MKTGEGPVHTIASKKIRYLCNGKISERYHTDMRFSEIQGDDRIRQRLIRTVKDQRVSHAQLFFGPEGNNKLALAIAYAQYINCANRAGSDDSCGVCPSCVKYQKLIHPDLHFIYPVSTTKKITSKPKSKYFIAEWREFLLRNNFRVDLAGWYEAIGIENKQGIINADDCNEIINTLGYKSYESEYKVMIIFMAEKIFYAAAPKILKILEEPPEKTLFILISENQDQILNTILSRTLLVKIPGSDILPAGPGEGDIHFLPFRQWMRDCWAGKVLDLITFSTEMGRAGREKQKSFLIYGIRIIGWCSAWNFRRHTPAGADAEEVKFIQAFSPFINGSNIHIFNELFNEAIYHVERNAHAPTLFLDLSLKIVRQFKPNLLPL